MFAENRERGRGGSRGGEIGVRETETEGGVVGIGNYEGGG